MKKRNITLIIVGSVVLFLLVASIVAANIKLQTYSVKLDIEGVNSYPPRLTQLVDRGVVKDTALVSILPSWKMGELYVGSPQTEMSGRLTLICGAGYEEMQLWTVSTNTYGVELLSKHKFEGVPADTTCIAEAVTDDCLTDIYEGRCEKLRKTITIKTPGDGD